MKYLLSVVVFLVPVSALAVVAPTSAPAVDPEVLLQNAMTMGAALPGALGAIFVGLIALAYAAIKISNYFADKGAREKAAYDLDQSIRKIQAENLSRMQKDASAGVIANMDENYKQDYEYIVGKIRDKKYESVYAKFSPKFHGAISQFLYDETLTPEDRGARVVLVVRPT